MPRLVSIIVYLASTWRLNEHAETLFLDGATDTGVCVRPRSGRMVLMDQDIMHRVCTPSLSAKRPRYCSLSCHFPASVLLRMQISQYVLNAPSKIYALKTDGQSINVILLPEVLETVYHDGTAVPYNLWWMHTCRLPRFPCKHIQHASG
jgi:hypothetical protein